MQGTLFHVPYINYLINFSYYGEDAVFLLHFIAEKTEASRNYDVTAIKLKVKSPYG